MTGPAIFGLIIWGMYLRFIVPVLGVFYGTSLMADEVEDKTITYLFTRPIPRGAVLVGKYLAYLGVHRVRGAAVGRAGLSPDRAAQGQPGRGVSGPAEGPAAARRSGLAVYGAVFAFVGAKFKRPLLIGLVFVFGWEQAALAFPGYLKQFTVMFYLQAIVPARDAERRGRQPDPGLFRETPEPARQPVVAGGHLGRFPWLGGPDRRAQGIRAGAVGLWALGSWLLGTRLRGSN